MSYTVYIPDPTADCRVCDNTGVVLWKDIVAGELLVEDHCCACNRTCTKEQAEKVLGVVLTAGTTATSCKNVDDVDGSSENNLM